MATNYTLQAGYTLTVTAGIARTAAHCVEDSTVGSLILPGFSRVFGPYLVERNFTVADGATVTTSAYGTSLGGLLTSNAGVPADAVAVDGPAITVSLATNGGSSITSTAAQVKAAIEASAPAAALVSVAIMTSDSGVADDGSGVVTAMTSTSLASGAGFGIGSVLPGGLCVDTTNADVYRNDGTTAAPVWVKVGDAA